VALGWAMWDAYMEAPWTRDGTVRVYTVTMAPEVAGRIVELPVADNQFVAKGQVLMVIDPTDYQIAVQLTQAAVQQAKANVDNVDAQIAVQQAQVNASQAKVEEAKASLVFAQQQSVRYGELAEKGFGPVQSAQQYSAEQREKQAAVESAEATLKLAERQVEALKVQRASTEASLAQAKAQAEQGRGKSDATPHTGAGQSRSHAHPLAGQRLGDQPVDATRRLRDRGTEQDQRRRRRFFLGGWLFHRDRLGFHSRGRSGEDQAHGLSRDRSRPCRQHRARHQRSQCATRPGRTRAGQSDLHLGALGPRHPGAGTNRSRARRRDSGGRPDGHCRDRAPRAAAGAIAASTRGLQTTRASDRAACVNLSGFTQSITRARP